ncbi:MAG: T9SS type A sorting domain-containing protein [Ignavibacteria bacterium]
MKKIIIILVVFQCSLQIIQAQWVLQTSGVSSNLYDVTFINRYTGWACGESVILKTTNAGNSWQSQTGIPQKLYRNICAIDSNTVYSVGWFQTIVKTTNGGTNWIILQDGPKGTGSSYEDVSFINKDTGWVSGTLGLILKTTNGGIDFAMSSVFAGYLYNIYFINAFTGITIESGLTTFKTTSGGLNWQNVEMPIGFEIPEFRKLTIINNHFGWVIGQGGGRVFRTNNFGDSWEVLDTIFTNRDMYSIGFADTSIGFTGGSFGVIYKTTDGGFNWLSQNNGGDPRFWGAIHCYNDSIVWGVGGAGKIMHTTTGGATIVDVGGTSEFIAQDYTLFQNYPNPFNSQTKIRYELKVESNVLLTIYSITGEALMILEQSRKRAGTYEINFNADELSSGVYIYSLTTDKIILNKKLLLIK